PTGLISETPTGVVSFGSNYTHVVHYTSGRRPASFTVFREKFMNLPPTNGLLGRLRNENDADLEDGNVLIIKHPLRDVRHIENMTPTDLACCSQTAAMIFFKGAAYGSVLDLNLLIKEQRDRGINNRS
ncbi:hypothetical protein M405DRAFT_828346, partial [Rhizopogon salebrosus TDB-379]